MEVIELQPEIDYVKIGQWIKSARLEHGYSQADLGALVGCSNNHMSHVEVGQTKVSLAMLLKLAFVLEKNFDYFLLDTPYAKCDSIIDNEIAAKLKKCNVTTLITVGKLIDVLIDQQEMIKKAELDWYNEKEAHWRYRVNCYGVLFCSTIYWFFKKQKVHQSWCTTHRTGGLFL